jgi:hypothetical protein
MADVIIKILEPAESFGFLTVDQARLLMQVEPGDPTGSDDFLNLLIAQNSDIVSTLCNRVFAREKVRETWRCIGEPCDCEDARTSRRLFLSHWPVKEDDVESVEVPRGYPVDRDCWELDERAGRISIFCGTNEPIVVTYWGGFDLPDEAPPALKYAATLLVTSQRGATQREASSSRMAGIKSIAHKESRVTFDTGAVAQATGGLADSTTPAMAAVKSLLSHFTRFWI